MHSCGYPVSSPVLSSHKVKSIFCGLAKTLLDIWNENSPLLYKTVLSLKISCKKVMENYQMKNVQHLIYPLDKRNTKKLKNKKTNQLFFLWTLVFQSNFFKKRKKNDKITFMKNSRNKNIILGFSIWIYVFGFSWCNGWDGAKELTFFSK